MDSNRSSFCGCGGNGRGVRDSDVSRRCGSVDNIIGVAHVISHLTSQQTSNISMMIHYNSTPTSIYVDARYSTIRDQGARKGRW